jgi:hypothetical protein
MLDGEFGWKKSTAEPQRDAEVAQRKIQSAPLLVGPSQLTFHF